jgi:multidrug efflux pump subunit AcrA (membrane-fusion protein)
MSEDDLKGLTLDKTQKIMGPQRRRKTLGVVVALVLVLAVAAGLYWGGVISPAVTVDVTTVSLVYPAQSLSFLNASGYVVAQRKAAVASKTTGRLTALLVAEGHRIKRGQIIARMENEDVTAGRNQAAANLNSARAALAQAGAERAYARTEYERYRSLLAQGFVSRSEFDLLETRYQKTRDGFAAAEAGVDAANAALRNAEASLAYTLIRAPFDAVVLTRTPTSETL